MAADVYLSYAKSDKALAEQLDKYLARSLRPLALLSVELSQRDNLTREFAQTVENAEVFLILLSPGYLESKFARDELSRAVGREDAGEAEVIPVLLRDVDLTGTLVAHRKLLPSDGNAIERRRDRETAFKEIADRVRAVRVRAEPPQPTEKRVPPPARPGSAELPRLSSSVQAAMTSLTGPVGAAAIVRRLLELHPEYGEGNARSVTVEDTSGATHAADQWIANVRELYREDAVPELHGRFVIRGLALLEPALTKQLLDHGFLAALEGELSPPLDEALSAHGRRVWEPGQVPTLADRPADTDRLARESFAAGLADMIEEERRTSRDRKGRPESFLVHLHGPWGSGKTSLLGFLGTQLRTSGSRWVVVDFNAWQHERLGAPWWSLMTAVHRAGLRAPFADGGRVRDLWRSLRLMWFEVIWRLRLGWMAYLLLPAVIGVLVYGWNEGWFETATTESGWLKQAGDIAKPVAAIVGLVAALLGAARGLGRSLAVGSARGAETFIRTSRDPMRTLRRRYVKLVSTIRRPVAVFIDDLDRCQSSFVVEVLQGVQTLLIEAPVTYVIAADRRWLYDSYAKYYSDFRSVAREPGRPIGHLFLEKTFQLSATLPQLPPDVRDEYWRWLIGKATEPEADEQRLNWVRTRTRTAGLDEVVAGVGAAPAAGRAEREALAERLAAPEVQQEIENRLYPFAGLLEPNPRAMKRLVNAYRIELRRLLAEGRRVGSAAVTPEQIALWTIVSLRWPLLADRLALQPELIAGAGVEDLPRSLRTLWASDEVGSVITGEGVSARLTAHAVRALAGLAPRAREETGAVAPSAANGHGVVA
jgi:KAP family P-loop domain/TIR domain